jgi:hypothetical protein
MLDVWCIEVTIRDQFEGFFFLLRMETADQYPGHWMMGISASFLCKNSEFETSQRIAVPVTKYAPAMAIQCQASRTLELHCGELPSASFTLWFPLL